MKSLIHLRPFDVTDAVSSVRVYSTGPAQQHELSLAGLVVIRYKVSVHVEVPKSRPRTVLFSTDAADSREAFVHLAAKLLFDYHPEVVPFCCVRHRLSGMDALPCAGLNREFI